jgi:hypothetical protein
MSDASIDLFSLLPSAIKIDDSQLEELKAWLDIASAQGTLLKQNLYDLWDDFFIETCADWVIPYIGDLVGNTPIYEVVHGRRADVARTIYFRRRKGTLPMLEELARYVTGWSVHAVAFFELMLWNQNMNHYRPGVGTVDVRSIDPVDTIQTAFDRFAHTADLRPFAPDRGWHNIKKIGFFVWRLNSYQLQLTMPRPGQSSGGVVYGYHFSALGNDRPLFNHPQAEFDETGLAGEIHVSAPIRPVAFFKSLTDDTSNTYRQYYQFTSDNTVFPTGISVSVIQAGTRQRYPVDAIICKNLSTWARPPAGKVAVDVRLGRLTFAAGEEPDTAADVRVHYCYGFSSELGGGPYDRAHERTPDTVSKPDALDAAIHVSPVAQPTISAALSAWNVVTDPQVVIQIDDSATYSENVALQNMPGEMLVIQAQNEERPTLIGQITIGRSNPADAATAAPQTIILEGLLIEGWIGVTADSGVNRLTLRHCTLVPGRALDEQGWPVSPTAPSLIVAAQGNDNLEITLDHCISGPLQVPDSITSLDISTSLIDSPGDDIGEVRPMVLSGSLPSPVTFASATPTFLLSLGDSDYMPIKPAGTTPAALQAAIRAAAPDDPAFAQAQVVRITIAGRWAIIPGLPVDVQIAAADGDTTTINDLRLDYTAGTARRGYTLISAPLPAALPSRQRKLVVTMEAAAPTLTTAESQTITLPAGSTTAAALGNDLYTAIRGASVSTAFSAALVARLDNNALLIIPGDSDTIPIITAAPDDVASLLELGLATRRPAIAGNYAGTLAGPPTSLVCVTVFGTSYLQALLLGSEVIFTDPVICQRRQVGCVRFSYLPPDSVTPRRYRCQPDSALESIPEADQPAVAQRLVPSFTSQRYGDPAYGQLLLRTAQEIRTGAENGAEMGAFNSLMQPQREANLRIRLEEYLPFGLEPGVIYIT